MSAPFYYVDGDRNKTPVDLSTQPQGTAMVLVPADGAREIHFTVGKTMTNSPSVIADRFNKTRQHPDRES